VPYWAIPYNKVNLPDSVLGAGLLVVIAVAALARAYLGRPFWRIVAVMGSVIPAVVMVRVMVDCSRDPTSHNLWPFEVFIAVIVGGAAALAGSVLGTLILLLLRKGRPGR
jgi:formate-dependent nitrite reductase membrane component NrfD